MRLGDLDAIEKFIEDGLNNPDKLKAFGHDAIEIISEVHYAPTIDAVPVSQLREILYNLERMNCGGDEGETYTTGYRNGHHNGQVELLRYILQIPDDTSEERKDGEENE